MNLETYNQAQLILEKLQDDGSGAEYFGKNSRRIPIQTDPFLQGLSSLASTHPELDRPLVLMGKLVKAVSKVSGTSIKVTGEADGRVNIRIQGISLSEPFGTSKALKSIAVRRGSGLYVHTYPDNENLVFARRYRPKAVKRLSLADRINDEVGKLTEEQIEGLAWGLVGIVGQGVALGMNLTPPE